MQSMLLLLCAPSSCMTSKSFVSTGYGPSYCVVSVSTLDPFTTIGITSIIYSFDQHEQHFPTLRPTRTTLPGSPANTANTCRLRPTRPTTLDSSANTANYSPHSYNKTPSEIIYYSIISTSITLVLSYSDYY